MGPVERARRPGAGLVVITRTPGEGRYATPEREQRWVLSGRPAGLDDPVSIWTTTSPGPASGSGAWRVTGP